MKLRTELDKPNLCWKISLKNVFFDIKMYIYDLGKINWITLGMQLLMTILYMYMFMYILLLFSENLTTYTVGVVTIIRNDCG